MGGRDDVPGLPQVLRKARMEAGLSQQQAGDRSGVHHISIARFETGKKTPTLASLYKLAEAYGVNICELLPGGVMPGAAPSKEKPPPEPPAPGPGKRGGAKKEKK